MMMLRTIEPGITVFTAAEIRVAVLPIGKVPRDIYDEYSDLINQYRHVSLSAAHSFYRETQKSPFQYMPWTTGLLHMRFLRDEDAFRRTRMVDLHSQRQVLAVIGIVYGAASPDLSAAYQEFVKVNRQFPEAFTNRCLVFEPTEQQIQQDTREYKDLVLFPPGDVSAPTQHLEVVMHDMAAAILSEVEKWMLSASPNMMKLNTYVDSGEFTGQLAVLDDLNKFRMQFTEEEIKEKRKWARLQKAKGDMCLLAGSPRDAYENYKSALELCKVTGDAVWYAAAEEGVAHARIIEALANSTAFTQPSSPSSPDGAYSEQLASEASVMKAAAVGFGGKEVWKVLREANLEQEVRELFADARSWYKRKGGAVSLQIEQQLKLARFLAGLKGLSARKEVSEMMSFVTEQVASLPLQDDRLVAMVEAAQVMGLVGSARKRALMLWQAVEQARTMEKSEIAALRIAIKALEPPDDPHQQDPDDFPRQHWTQRRSNGGVPHSWEAVHMASLEGALQAARQARAPAEAWEAAAALIREHHHMLSPAYQLLLVDQLSQAAAAMSSSLRVRPGPGPGPHICLNRILPCALALQPLQVKGRRGADQEDPFIFNPYVYTNKKDKEASNPEWVCGDDCWVEVLVSNPAMVTMKLDRINLHVRYDELALKPGAPRPWQAVPVSMELPPQSKAQRHHLNLKLLQPGQVTLLGCQVSMWGIQWAQPFILPPKRTSGSGPPPPRPQRKPGATATDATATVDVLAPMPLLRATVRSPDFSHTEPSEVQLQRPSGLPGDNLEKVAPVQVLEGQVVTWSLTLTNIGQETAATCKVVVSEQKQGSARVNSSARTTPHFTGVMADVDMTALNSALPLQPLDSVTVPLKLQVGRAPENFDEVMLEVRITYMAENPGGDSPGPNNLIYARCLVLPLCLHIQPTLQVSAVRFLELSCPVVDGCRVLPSNPAALSRALQMYVDETKAKKSAGGTGGGSTSSSQTPSPKKKGNEASSKGSKGWLSARGGPRDGPLAEMIIRGADLVADERACLSQQCVAELTISNTCSDRYFKAWVAPTTAEHDPGQAESAVIVIQPGDPSTLLTVLTRQPPPPPPISPPDPHPPFLRPGQKPPTLEDFCTQYIIGSRAVFWEMITAKQSNEKAPQGILLLPQAEVLKSVTSNALGMLRPRQLQVSFCAVSVAGAQCMLVDLSELLQQSSFMPEDSVGQVWGLQLQEGGLVTMELQLTNHAQQPLQGTVSIAQPPGALLSGVVSKLRFSLEVGASESHRFAVMVASPGLHQLDVREVELEQSKQSSSSGATTVDRGGASSGSLATQPQTPHTALSSIPDVSVDKFMLYCPASS